MESETQAVSQVRGRQLTGQAQQAVFAVLLFKPHKGPRLSPCKVTEKFPNFCRRICFAFWVPVIISDIAPTHPSVLGGPAGESQTDRRRRKVLQGTMSLGKVWTSRLAGGLRAHCLLPAAPFDESFAKEPGQREL